MHIARVRSKTRENSRQEIGEHLGITRRTLPDPTHHDDKSHSKKYQNQICNATRLHTLQNMASKHYAM